MAGYKAVGLVFVRRRARDAGVEAALCSALSPSTLAVYQEAVATAWIPIEAITEVFEKAAPLLFPSAPNPLMKLGDELMVDNANTVYRWLFRMFSVPFIIDKTASMWRTYHQEGEARLRQTGERELVLEITGYPTLPAGFRICHQGFVERVLWMTNPKTCEVVAGGDPSCWTWTFRWT